MFGSRYDAMTQGRSHTKHGLRTALDHGDDPALAQPHVAVACEGVLEPHSLRHDIGDRHPAAAIGVDDPGFADDAFGKAVFAEPHHLVVDALGEVALVVAL